MSYNNIGSLGKGVSKYRKKLDNLPNWFKEVARKHLENHKDDELFLARIKIDGVILSKNGCQVLINSVGEFDIIKEWAGV